MSVLFRQAVELKPGDHLLSIYGTPEERIALLLPFFEAGLERGERCLYIPGGDAEPVLEALEKSGLSIPRFVALGRMSVLNPQELSSDGGPFEAKLVLERVLASAERARREGFRGLRVAWEANRILQDLSRPMGFFDHEAELSDLCRRHRPIALCQYDRRRVPEELLLQALRAHPRVVVGRRLCRNLYYFPLDGHPRDPGQELDLQLKRVLEQETLTEDLRGQVQRSARRAEELAVLNAIATVVSHSLDLSLILNDALEAVLAVLEVEAGHIRLLDEVTDELVLMASRGRSEAFVKGRSRVRWEESSLARLRASGEALVVADLQEEREVPAYALAFAEGHRSYAAIPLAVQGRIVGTLSVLSRAVGKFQPEDIQFLTAIGHQLGIAVERARLDQELRQNLERKQALVEELKRVSSVAAQIVSGPDLSCTLEWIVKAAALACGTDKNSILLVDGEAGELVHGAAVGLPEAYIRAIARFPIGPSAACCGTAAYRNEVVIVEDVRIDPLTIPYLDLLEPYGLRAIWSVPLRDRQGKVLGTFATYYEEPYRPTPEQIEIAELYACHAAIAIENARLFQKLSRQNRTLAALNRVAAVMNRSLRLQEILETAMEAVLEAVEVEAGLIRLWEEREGRLVIAVHRGISVEYLQRVRRLKIGEGFAGQAFLKGEPLVVEDVSKHPRFLDSTLKEDIRSLACIPIRSRDKAVGVMSIFSHGQRRFVPDEVELLRAIGYQLGTALENAKLFEQAKEGAARLQAVLETTEAINSQLHSSEILQLIIDKAVEVLGTEKGILFELDEESQSLVPVAWCNLSRATEGFRLRVGESVGGRVVLWKRPIAIPDVEADTEHEVKLDFARREGIRAFLTMPLIVRDRVVGIISVHHTVPHHFSDEEITHLALFAHQAAVAIENARSYQKIQQYASSVEKLYKAGIQVSASLEVGQTLQFIVQSAVEATGAASSTIILFEGSGGISQVTVWDPSGALDGTLQVRPDGISRKVVGTGKLWMIQDFGLAPPGLVNPDLIQAGRQAAICLPLQFKDRVGGVMWIHYDAPRAFSEQEIHLLSSFATQAALAVEHARLFQATQRKAGQLEALFETTKLLASTYELEEALRLLAEVAVRVTGAAGCVILSVDEDEGRLILRGASGQEVISCGDRLLDEGVLSCLCSQVIKENRPLVLDDRDRRADLFCQDFGERGRFGSLLFVPVQIRGKVLGVITAFFTSPLDSGDEVVGLVSTIARLAAIAVEDTRLLSRSALLQEVHHRVKNNLQTVAGLLYLQQTYCRPKSGKVALQESITRIRSIAAVHDLLSLDNIGLTRIKELFRKIVELSLVEGDSRKKVQAAVEGPDFFLPSKEATSLALVINELVSNAVRHGFEGRKRGRIEIRILADVDQIAIAVKDDGRGLPQAFDLERDANLGLKIVESIARKDLSGTFMIASDRVGTTARVTFPRSVKATVKEGTGR